MRTILPLLCLSWLTTTCLGAAETFTLVVDDPGGKAGRVAAPISVAIDLGSLLEKPADAAKLRLVEVTGSAEPAGPATPVQFIPNAKTPTKGRLWWLMPEGVARERRFRLSLAEQPSEATVTARVDEHRGVVNVFDGDEPVIRYNHDTVPPPPAIVEHFEKNRKPPLHYARGDYIHPVYGPDGEELTDDYSLNHPHHRGVSWAWPVVRYQGEVRDLWAVRVLPTQPGGVWARPVSLDRAVSGPVLALIDATNVWKWGDQEPIVEEQVVIRSFRQNQRCRYLDVDLHLTALVDGVRIGGRPGGSYGGFSFRTYPEFDERQIDMQVDPEQRKPRRAWFHLSGNFPGGKGPAGVVLMEHVDNPDYPSFPTPNNADRVPGQYPKWRTVQPAWPGDREVELPKGEPITLKHRLWIHPGEVDAEQLGALWATYADPPRVRVEQ